MSMPSEDISESFLKDLFGAAYDAFMGGTIDPSAMESGNLIAEMMGIVNSFFLTATAFVIIYTVAIGLMETSHAGETLGKRYSTLWTPIRGALGVMFVAPFPGLGGFSVLQALILAAVGLSVGAGNMLWQKELEYFGRHGTVYPIVNGGMPDSQLINKAIESLVCHEHQKAEYRKREQAVDDANFFLKGWTWLTNAAFTTTPAEYQLPHSSPSANGFSRPRHHDYGYKWSAACGEIYVECPAPDPQGQNGGGGRLQSESTRAICLAKGEATVAMIDALRPIAKRIYASTPEEAEDSGEVAPTGANNPNLPAELQAAVNTYATTYWSHYDRARNAMNTERDSAMRQFLDVGGIGGWISAGQWHWVMAKVSLATNQAAFITPKYVDIDNGDIFNYEDEYIPLAARVKKFTDYMPRPSISGTTGDNSPSITMVGGGSNTDGGDAEAQMQKILGSKLDALNSIVLDPGDDPIGTLSSFGGSLISTSTGIVTGYALLKGAAAGVSKSMGSNPLSGIAAGIPAAIHDILGTLGNFILFLALPMMIAGGFLAYYLPAVPFIFWMFGVLGWMIMIVESLIAAPVWAASHVIPEGEGFAGNAARQGWMLFLNILFRPILLVLGLFFSMLMMYFIAQLALSGYTVYHSSVALSNGSMGGFFAYVFGNIILIGLVVALSHKSHEMIYETADNVMRWVGANTKPLGEAQGEASVSRTYGAAAAYVGQGTNAAIAKGGGGAAGGPGKPKGVEDDPESNNGQGAVAGGSEAGGRGSGGGAATPGEAMKGNIDTGKSSGVNGGGSEGGSGGEANGASESGGRKGKEEL